MDSVPCCCVVLFWSYYCVSAWFVNMLSNSRSASPAFPSTPSSPRPKLPFLPLGRIRRGLNGHGAHDGPWSGRPPPRPGVPPCRGATWPGTHPGTDRGPATWWLQPTGLVWYRPVNTKINITLHFLLGKNLNTLAHWKELIWDNTGLWVCFLWLYKLWGGTFRSLWPQRVQTAPNYQVVWCGVCVMLHGVWSVCVVLTNSCRPSPSAHLLFFHSLVPFFFLPSPHSCIMWSGWTCIVIRPYGGGRVSESAWRWLNNSKQSFLSMGTPLGQTRFKCGSGLLAWRRADFKSWRDNRF